jgi:hypothetical protein
MTGIAGPQSICLSLIVKDENGPHLRRCLESVRPFIAAWAVVDTGSTDGTQELIRSLLADIPGQLIERAWVDDFAHSRNQALDLARESGAEFAMVLDADDHVVPRGAWVALIPFDTDVVSIPGIDDGKLLLLPTFVRLSAGLRFHGRVHEIVVRPDGSLPFGVSDPSYVMRRTRDGRASVDAVAKRDNYRRLMLLAVAEAESDAYMLEALARDALTRGELLAGRHYLDQALQHVPHAEVHRRYTLRLSRISTFLPFAWHMQQIAAEIEDLMRLCPDRAEAPRWMASHLRKNGFLERAEYLDDEADQKAIMPAYGVDYSCYRATPLQRRIMKYIVLPEPIAIDTVSWTFSNCVTHVIDHAESFTSPASMIRAGQRILTAVDKAVDEKKAFVELRDEDLESLKAAFDAPSRGYGVFMRQILNPETAEVIGHEPIKVPARLFLRFIDAVMDAQSTPPAPPVVVGETGEGAPANE